MTREKIAKELFKRGNLKTQKEANEILELIIAIMRDSLIDGEKITLARFGTLLIVKRKERTITVPGKDAPEEVPEKKTVKFQISKILKTEINS